MLAPRASALVFDKVLGPRGSTQQPGFVSPHMLNQLREEVAEQLQDVAALEQKVARGERELRAAWDAVGREREKRASAQERVRKEREKVERLRKEAEKIGDQRARYRELCRDCESLAEERDEALETALQAEADRDAVSMRIAALNLTQKEEDDEEEVV